MKKKRIIHLNIILQNDAIQKIIFGLDFMRVWSYQNQSHHWLDLCSAAYNSNTLNNTDSRKSNFTLNFIEKRFRVTHKY